jgi:hypothetical protein
MLATHTHTHTHTVFGDTGVWIQDFALARQVLHSLICTSRLFYSGYLKIGSCFWPRPAWALITIAGMVGVGHYTQLLLYCDGVSRTFFLGQSGTLILPISASWVARITGMSHQCPAQHIFFIFSCCNIFSQLITCLLTLWCPAVNRSPQFYSSQMPHFFFALQFLPFGVLLKKSSHTKVTKIYFL